MDYFKNDFILARINKSDARLYTEWLRTVSLEEFREGVELFLKLIIEEDIELWIVDASKLHGIRLADQQWILNKIVPGISQSKLRKLARIASGDIFQYISFEEMIEKAISKTGTKIEVAQFTSLAMAEVWINMQE